MSGEMKASIRRREEEEEKEEKRKKKKKRKDVPNQGETVVLSRQ
jgi:hypothetical protein